MQLPLRYTRTAIALHWVVALLILVNVTLGLVAESLPDAQVRLAVDTHKSIGITVLGLAILRLLWRLSHPAPPLPPGYPRWERLSAHAAHIGLYALIFALPLSGWLHDSAWKAAATHPMQLFGLVPWPRIGWVMSLEPGVKAVWHDRFGDLHTWLGYALYVLFGLHLVGALKHQWLDRQPELQRMLPGPRRGAR